MRLALDVDGVLAAFDPAFAALLTTLTGKPCKMVDPDEWEWPRTLGFTKAEEEAAWKHINAHPAWWRTLGPYQDSHVDFAELELRGHDIYFVTARRTNKVRYQTAYWLDQYYPIIDAAVICSADKGLVCKALKIDAFIDDKADHCIDVRLVSPKTKSYLRARTHNRVLHKHMPAEGIVVTDSLQTFLKDLNL